MTEVATFARSLDQELLALLRGASLECLVCGEFVMHAREGVEESPDTVGQDAGVSQAAKADGKWNRKQTAADESPETSAVRVKRWGKSPPASRRRGGSPNPVRCKANRARHEAARPGPG